MVVAAKNEEKNIHACVSSILAAVKGSVEVWVVNDGSTDKTREILKEFEYSIRVLEGEGRGPSHARNMAIKETQRPYIAFVDGDSVVKKDWLETLVSELNQQDAIFVGIGGIQKSFDESKGWEAFHAKFLEAMGFVSDYVHQGQETSEVEHNPTCNVLYRKDIIMDICGFDESLWPCEDLDLDLRLRKKGCRLLFSPKSVIYHHRPDSFLGFMHMMKRYGFGHAHIVKKHGLCQKIHMLPFVFLFFIILTLSMFFLPDIAKTILSSLGLILILWLLFVLCDYSKFLMKKTMYGFYCIPAAFSWNLGFFSGLFRKKKISSI